MTHGTNWCRQPTTSQSTRTLRRGRTSGRCLPSVIIVVVLGPSVSPKSRALPRLQSSRGKHPVRTEFTSYSGHLSIIVVEHSAKSLTPHDRSGLANLSGLWNDQSVAEPLVISFTMIMGHELVNRLSQRAFSEQDHPLQAGLFDTAHKSLGVGIQIRRSRRQFHRLYTCLCKHVQEFVREQWIAIMDEVSLPSHHAIDRIGQIPTNLTHPQSVRCTCDPCHLDLPCR